MHDKDINKRLITAALCGEIDAARECLAKGANPNFRNNDGRTPLDISLSRCTYEVAEILLENGARIDAFTEKGSNSLLHTISVYASAVEREAHILLDMVVKYDKHASFVNLESESDGSTAYELLGQQELKDYYNAAMKAKLEWERFEAVRLREEQDAKRLDKKLELAFNRVYSFFSSYSQNGSNNVDVELKRVKLKSH